MPTTQKVSQTDSSTSPPPKSPQRALHPSSCPGFMFFIFFFADKNSPFYYDWYGLRVGGLIFAGILCAMGIIVLMSGKCKCKFRQKPRLRPNLLRMDQQKELQGPLSPSPGSAREPELQDGILHSLLRPPGQGSISPLPGGVSVQFLL
uniref:FXYD domain-containing ion transport regulator n=1 Tax=Moschus moschiferus TaxID=68415 RepID=A0A8C6FGT9_MOSMO